MRELEYCRKYAAGLIKVTTLAVTINVLQEGSTFRLMDIKDSFRLTLHGYPSANNTSIENYLERDDGAAAGLLYKDGAHLCSAVKGV